MGRHIQKNLSELSLYRAHASRQVLVRLHGSECRNPRRRRALTRYCASGEYPLPHSASPPNSQTSAQPQPPSCSCPRIPHHKSPLSAAQIGQRRLWLIPSVTSRPESERASADGKLLAYHLHCVWRAADALEDTSVHVKRVCIDKCQALVGAVAPLAIATAERVAADARARVETQLCEADAAVARWADLDGEALGCTAASRSLE